MIRTATSPRLKRLATLGGRQIERALSRGGLHLTSERRLLEELDPAFVELLPRCRGYTMTTIERMYALFQAVDYVAKRKIPGDFVECGVWRGGSSMLAALALQRLGDDRRHLHLFDTFAGMSEPTSFDGPAARAAWAAGRRPTHNELCYSSLAEVDRNMLSTGLSPARLHLVEGRVEDTIPASGPDAISILRLDTDWYESTRHELVHLMPRLSPGGILIVDDYGFWKGARRAVDEYFAEADAPMLLNRIDSTGRLGLNCT